MWGELGWTHLEMNICKRKFKNDGYDQRKMKEQIVTMVWKCREKTTMSIIRNISGLEVGIEVNREDMVSDR